MKEYKKEMRKGFRTYSKVLLIFSNLIVTILFGVVIGVMIDKWQQTKKYTTIFILVFSLIAMYNFFKEILKIK